MNMALTVSSLFIFSGIFIVISRTDAYSIRGSTTVATEGVISEDGVSLHRRLPDKLLSNDLCRDGSRYIQCDPERFPTCSKNYRLCFYRVRPGPNGRAKVGHYDSAERFDKFYIRYDWVECVPKWWNCDRCWMGRFCYSDGYCMTSNNYRKFCRERDEEWREERRRKRSEQT